MKVNRIEEYHKHGCHFFGSLAVVDYAEDMQRDQIWGTFNAGLTYEYLDKAKALIKERYGDGATETLLSIPELVVRIL